MMTAFQIQINLIIRKIINNNKTLYLMVPFKQPWTLYNATKELEQYKLNITDN